MTKNELLQNISLATAIQRSTCEQVIDALREEIKNALSSGDKVMIKDFLSFEIGERDARNPRTGEVEHYPAVKTVKVKVCKKIKDAVNGKGES